MTKKMHNLSKLGPVLILALFILAGCYPKGPEYYADLDLTVTDYDIDYNFGEQKKYFMADTVEYITNIDDSELDPADEEKLLQEIESNFTSRGYQRLDPADIDDAQFVVTVSVIASESTSVGWVPGYPCYPGWGWGCGFPPYYPPYWGGYYSYSYTTGSVIINWWDPQSPTVPQSSEEAQPIHWVAAFNGMVSSSKENNAARIQSGINQAFKQSLYIQSK